MQTRSTTRENSIVDFSRFEFPADFSTKRHMKNDTPANLVLKNKSIDGQKRPLLKNFVAVCGLRGWYAYTKRVGGAKTKELVRETEGLGSEYL